MRLFRGRLLLTLNRRDHMGLRVVRSGALLLAIPLQPVIDSPAAYRRSNPNGAIRPAMLRVEAQSGNVRALASVTQLGGMKRPDGMRLTSFEGELILRLP